MVKKIIRFIVLIIGLSLVAYSGYHLFKIFWDYRTSDKTYEKLQDAYTVDDSKKSDDNDSEAADTPWYDDIDIDFAGLRSENPDVVGWIYFENEDISYPVMYSGGWPGAENLGQDTVLTGKLKEFAADPKKWVAAICAAPYVLGGLGLLRGKRATCYPGFEKYLEGADVTGGRVERDGHIITGRGPGTASDFALELVEVLEGKEKAEDVRDGLAG